MAQPVTSSRPARSASATRPTLLLVGHGSRDPRSAQALRDLRERVAARAGGRVELAFLELSEPLLEDVLAGLRGEVRIVPLLLGTAFHATDDLPGRVQEALAGRRDVSVGIGNALGPHPLLDAAVAARARDLVAQGHEGVVLLGTGSSHESANREVHAVAERIQRALGVPVRAAFVTRGASLETVVESVRSRGASRLAVVPWFLAPGRLLDAGARRASAAGVDALAPPLADDDRLVDVVLSRAAVSLTLAA